MKRIRYEPQIKAAIIAAVQEARKSGKTWKDALGPAMQAGYKGTEDGLYQLVSKSATKAPATASSRAAPPATKVKKAVRRRQAKRVAAAPRTKAPTVPAPTSAPLDITALVLKTVTDAVVTAMESLVTKLKSGK